MITNICREAEAKWLVGAEPSLPQVIALGTGTAGVSSSSSALDKEYYRQYIDFRWSPKKYASRFSINLPSDTPPPRPGESSIVFTEIGLFDGSMIGVANANFEVWSGSPETPSYWTKSGEGASWNKGTAAYQGSYALEVIAGDSFEAQIYQDLILADCRGKVLTSRIAVKASAGSQARIGFYDGSSTTYSDYHSGGGDYELLQCTASISSSATKARMILEVAPSGTASFDWIQCFQSGKLWARSTINQEKVDGTPLNLSWEILTEEGDMIRDAYETQEISSGTASAGSLDPDKYQPAGQTHATEVLITVEDNPIRYWMHGGTPTATSGHLAGTVDPQMVHPLSIEGANNIRNLRFIGINGTAKLKVTYLR